MGEQDKKLSVFPQNLFCESGNSRCFAIPIHYFFDIRKRNRNFEKSFKRLDEQMRLVEVEGWREQEAEEEGMQREGVEREGVEREGSEREGGEKTSQLQQDSEKGSEEGDSLDQMVIEK